MDKIQTRKFQLTLLLILQMPVSVLLVLAEDYTLPEQYFLSCGSESTVKFGSRGFVPDGSFFVGQSETINATTATGTSSPLYQTARVLKGQNSYYQFEINETGTYAVRLHFFASLANLSNAEFNVKTDGFSLLSNFSVPWNRNSTDPVVKEFWFTINNGKFRIYFTPYNESSFAFINAMEVFLAPEDLFPNEATHIAAEGSKDNYTGLLSGALHEIDRLNVGGLKITADADTMLRTWVPDEDFFLSDPQSVENKSYQTYSLNTNSKFFAPDLVYRTAKVTQTNASNQTNVSFITWGFNVSQNSRYLIRAHFLDVVSPPNESLVFNFKVNNNFSRKISPNEDAGTTLAFPFHLDFVFESYNSETMNVSVGPTTKEQYAFLNGLEIFQVMEKSSRPKKNNHAVVFGSIGGVVLLAILLAVVAVVMHLRSSKIDKGYSGMLLNVPLYGGNFNKRQDTGGSISLVPSISLALKMKYSEIRRATKNFSRKRFIGGGGFGKVYRGILRDGKKVAVKRSEPGYEQGFKEFENEIKLLSKIRHRHLVSLVGYCDDRSEMILVYEFMEKGTLREHLYDANPEKSSSRSKLSWEERLKICIGAAEGLEYLHTQLDAKIIHRDVKSTNILLDENWIAKVSDFGISKTGLHGDPGPDATAIKGSVGYMDPEIVTGLQPTEKSDVYSFGVVLLEVLCARPVNIPTEDTKSRNLVDLGLYCLRRGQLESIVDPFLRGTINSDSLRIFGDLVESCLRSSGSDRPTMGQVKYDLEYALNHQKTSMQRQQQEESLIGMDSSFVALGIISDIATDKIAVE